MINSLFDVLKNTYFTQFLLNRSGKYGNNMEKYTTKLFGGDNEQD